MTERKPVNLSFTSWIDQQIDEASQRGAFDDLPGAGKPLPRRAVGDAAQAWLQDWLRREGVSADDLLPTPLRLRKEVERLTGSVHELHSEQQVREIAAELNRQIIQWRRIPEGPPVYLRLVDADALVARWRATAPAGPAAARGPGGSRPAALVAPPPQAPGALGGQLAHHVACAWPGRIPALDGAELSALCGVAYDEGAATRS